MPAGASGARPGATPAPRRLPTVVIAWVEVIRVIAYGMFAMAVCQQCLTGDTGARDGGARVAELKKGSRVTGMERDRLAGELRRKYDSGESIRSLAASTGRSYGFVHRMLSEGGVSLRGRGGATRGRKAS